MKLFSRAAITVLWIAGTTAAVAQSTLPASANITLAATVAALPSLTGSLKGPDAQQAAEWIKAADTLKAFSDAHPGTSDAGEARALEARYLIRAAEAGDKSQSSRLAALVKAVRGDSGIGVHSRFLVASLDNHLGIEQRPKMTHAERLAAYETSARDMIASFPSEPMPYWALVSLARDAVDEQAGFALAQEVAAMPGAPPVVQGAARDLIGRVGLLGKGVSASYQTPDGNRHELVADRGHPVVIYTWAANNRGSQLLAAKLTTLVDPTAIVIGICIDWNMATATSVAAQGKLPGQVVYGQYGAGGLAAALHATDAGRVYLIDSLGILRRDRGQFDLPGGLRAVGALKGGAQ